jgi:hypothetical protein
MWASVKGKTENALLRLPFKAAYMFRPAFIQPLHGITSRTRMYRVSRERRSPCSRARTSAPWGPDHARQLARGGGSTREVKWPIERHRGRVCRHAGGNACR